MGFRPHFFFFNINFWLIKLLRGREKHKEKFLRIGFCHGALGAGNEQKLYFGFELEEDRD